MAEIYDKENLFGQLLEIARAQRLRLETQNEISRQWLNAWLESLHGDKQKETEQDKENNGKAT